MRRSSSIYLILFLMVAVLFVVGCGPKAPPVSPTLPPPAKDPAPPPPPPTPAPTVSISASPTTVERGEQTTLTWDSGNTSSLSIDGGIGNVAGSGSIVVSPAGSTTYTATATGPGGEGRASTRVTVLEPRPPVDVSTDADKVQEAINNGTVRPVFFDYDKADLTEESKVILRENARIFRLYPQARVAVEGHCDERGTEEYNLALGDNRAVAAKEFLVELGVDPAQLDTISFGEERPFNTGQNEAAWAENRRAHFSVRR